LYSASCNFAHNQTNEENKFEKKFFGRQSEKKIFEFTGENEFQVVLN